MRTIIALGLLLVAACAGDPGEMRKPTYPIGEYRADTLASETLCDRAVTNYEKKESFSTMEPISESGHMVNRNEFDSIHRDRVRRCTASISERAAACIAQASSAQSARNCKQYSELR